MTFTTINALNRIVYTIMQLILHKETAIKIETLVIFQCN